MSRPTQLLFIAHIVGPLETESKDDKGPANVVQGRPSWNLLKAKTPMSAMAPWFEERRRMRKSKQTRRRSRSTKLSRSTTPSVSVLPPRLPSVHQITESWQLWQKRIKKVGESFVNFYGAIARKYLMASIAPLDQPKNAWSEQSITLLEE